jgi:RNA polymerase sigma factor (sigma-70 family)
MGRSPAVSRIDQDRGAFEEFYRAHFDEVLRFVTRRVADAHTAADLTAEVFVAALDSASSYRGDGSPSAWLIGIARHVVTAEYRRAARDRDAQQRATGRRLLDADDIDCVEARIDAERQARRVYQDVQRLPPAERAVLELIAVDGLTLAQTAAVLRIKPVTARVRLYRARRALERADRAQRQGESPQTTHITMEVRS